MSLSYKLAIVGAVVLCGGILTYHLLQSDPSSSAPTVAPPQPTRPQSKMLTPSSDPPRPASANAPDPETIAPTQDQPGLSDLMSRIRRRMDQPSDEALGLHPSTGLDALSPLARTTPKQLNQDLATPATEAPDPLTDGDSDSLESPHQPQEPTDPAPPRRVSTPIVVTHRQDDPPATPQPNDDPQQAPEPEQHQQADHAPKTTADNPGAPQTYTVYPGDTFSTIAVKVYGSEHHWIDIAMANPFVDPKQLYVGQQLNLPSTQELLDAGMGSAGADDSGQTLTHIVRPGETLTTIAKRYYNNPNRWRVIFDTNRDKIGNDPDRLQAGELLKIPVLSDSPSH